MFTKIFMAIKNCFSTKINSIDNYITIKKLYYIGSDYYLLTIGLGNINYGIKKCNQTIDINQHFFTLSV